MTGQRRDDREAERAREELARLLHLTLAKLESDYEDWDDLSDEQRFFYRKGVEVLVSNTESILAAVGRDG
jgi:hypothetical protein